jgi:hypothetical protein
MYQVKKYLINAQINLPLIGEIYFNKLELD